MSETIPPSLDVAMMHAEQHAREAETGESRIFPYLYLHLPNGELHMIVLGVRGGGPAYAAVARAEVEQRQPAVAVLSCEAWVAALPPDPQSDPRVAAWVRRREAGEPVGVIDLPEEFRRDSLMLIGEARDGTRALRGFFLQPPATPGQPRTLEPMSGQHDGTDDEIAGVATRFFPLFGVEWALRHGMPAEVARKAIHLQMQTYAPHLKREEMEL